MTTRSLVFVIPLTVIFACVSALSLFMHIITACGCSTAPLPITKRPFGKLPDGTAVDIYTLRNKNGLEAEITNYGGAVVSLKTPDRVGRMADIVLGYDSPSGYASDTSYFGALIGRYANRIAGGKFKLGGVEYQLAQNNGVDFDLIGPLVLDPADAIARTIMSMVGA